MLIPAITLPPLYVPPGQPQNEPIRKSRKTTAFIVNVENDSDEDDNVPLARSAYAKNEKQGQKRGAPKQSDGGAATPPQKKKKTTKTAAAKKSFQLMKQWSNEEEPTPPPSDDDDLLVIDGRGYIKTGDFMDGTEGEEEEDNTEEHIEPSQMDKIVTPSI